MSSLFERITLNPYSEGLENEPIELSAWRGGQGIFLDGATYAPAPEDVHLAQSVDTEGATAVARTVKERPSPEIKIRVIEPTDPAGTNFVFNPQVLIAPNHETEAFGGGDADISYLNSVGPSLESATPVAAQEKIADLNGFEYAAFVFTPGTAKNEGIMWGGAGGNPKSHTLFQTFGVPGRTDAFPVAKQNAPYTGGVWMRGAVGGESVDLVLVELFNLVPDPSFEYDTTGSAPALWEHKGHALTNFKVEGGGGLAGAKSLRVSSSGTVGKTETVEVLNKPEQSVVTPGTRYSASLMVENNKAEVAGVEVALQIKWSNGETTTSPFATLKAGIQTLNLENVGAPSVQELQYAQLCLIWRNESVGATEMDVNIDAAILCHGALPTYFDGDSLESRWLGASGASYSWLGSKTSIVLTTSWRWYTVTRANWETGTRCALLVRNPNEISQSWFVTGAAIVQGSELTEYFDGSWPGCYWEGTPYTSASVRPAPGGPRRDAIMADVERAVTQVSRLHSGTLRRTLANGHQITFDLLNAQLTWDEQQFLSAGTAAGTIKFTSEPYGRSPEMTIHQDAFLYGRPQDYFMQAGLWTDFTFGSYSKTLLPGLRCQSHLGTEHIAIYSAGQYPLFSNETEIGGEVGTLTAGMKWGAIVAWLDEQNYLEGYLTDDGATTRLRIDQVIEGIRTNLATTNFSERIKAKTRFTVRCRLQNDEVFCEYYPREPRPYEGVEPTVGVSATTLVREGSIFPSSHPSSPQPFPFNSLTPHLAGWTFTAGAANNTLFQFLSDPYVFRSLESNTIEFMVTGVPGSAPALGRMIVTSDGANDQWWMTWGQISGEAVELNEEQESLWSETGVLNIEACIGRTGANTNRVLKGPKGTSGQQSKNVVEAAALPSESLAVRLETAVPPGIYQVFARVYDQSVANVGSIHWRAVWGQTAFLEAGDLVSNSFVTAPVQNDWCLINLGQINIPRGSPPWAFKVGPSRFVSELGITLSHDEESGAASSVGYIDRILLVPVVDGSGVAEGVSSIQPNPEIGVYDGFATTAGNLNGTSTEVGANVWVTSGTGADFVRSISNKRVERTGEGNKQAVVPTTLSSTYYVRAGLNMPSMPGSAVQFGIMLVYKNSTNWCAVVYNPTNERYEVLQNKGGVISQIAKVKVGGNVPSALGSQTVTVYASIDHASRVTVWLWVRGNGYQGTAPAMRCHYNGERPLSPEVGLYDNESVVPTERRWIEFTAGEIEYDAAIMQEGSLEIRSDQVNRTAKFPGEGVQNVSRYEGDYLKIPPPIGGQTGSRFIVRVCRNNPATETDSGGFDPISAFLSVTPRWANIPNA